MKSDVSVCAIKTDHDLLWCSWPSCCSRGTSHQVPDGKIDQLVMFDELPLLDRRCNRMFLESITAKAPTASDIGSVRKNLLFCTLVKTQKDPRTVSYRGPCVKSVALLL